MGGGPGGTATAFRAKELGLEVLVIDYDDLMKRIRDYSKDKLILPGFGGGDRLRFPKGEELIASLSFAAIDKDDLHQGWKKLYEQHGVEAQTGVELTAIQQDFDGVHQVQAWDHKNRCGVRFAARHVAIAIGRGVPRRFNIPGDTAGIALRLKNPESYVGLPACVIGGGTSAAEAVVALSEVKAAANDASPVYWSYRGERMPRVSKALADVFFEAYVGNGNIRYYPNSEPTAVITAEDRAEYLCIRTDRRWIEGRPNETTHLEFPKGCCLACIGEDMPESLLATLGAPLVEGGPKGRKRALVNRFLETRVPNLYLVGDLLSQAYFEAENFDCDPAVLSEVKHPGNIKSALRDGVRVAQIVRQRIDGKIEVSIEIEDGEELGPLSGMVPWVAAASATTPEDLERTPEPASLVHIFVGGEIEEHALVEWSVMTIGRRGCDINCPDDTLLSDKDASVSATASGFVLRDDGSSAGVFLELAAARKFEVEAGDLVRCGRQFLRVDKTHGQGMELVHFGDRGREVGRYPLAEGSIVLGRRGADVILDRSDRTLSRRHLSFTRTGDRLEVKDLKSANGTLLRVCEGMSIGHGDRFRVGEQTFGLNLKGDAAQVFAAPSRASVSPAASEEATLSPSEERESPPADSGDPSIAPSVTFSPSGKCVAVKPGQTICEAAEAAGVAINVECRAGICGSDPIRIVSGQEFLVSGPDRQETETLEDLCNLEAGPCRLACQLRITGPVEVEIL